MKNNYLLTGVLTLLVGLCVSLSGFSQNGGKTATNKDAKFDLFVDQMPSGAQWSGKGRYEQKGGPKDSKAYIYVKSSESPAGITGLSLKIRKNPGAGEYRYITFTWIKWAGTQIGIKFNNAGAAEATPSKYDYTYFSGEGDAITKGIKLNAKAPGNWVVTTRDLWQDFGDFTITDVAFICPDSRDAGFDAISLARSQNLFTASPKVLPTEVAAPIAAKGAEDLALSDKKSEIIEEETTVEEPQKVQIDWKAQIEAGGIMMYPLYALGLVALVISLQRFMTSRRGRLAPKKLCSGVRQALANGDIDGAIALCDQYPSTLAQSLRFIFEHSRAGREAVSETAGDIAARDIRTHLSRIYPLSVIASLSPLIGLLGTIVGMIEAFGLVAMYGDEGGSAILSDSISKALITTAAGLIIAAPSIALYFVIRNRIMNLASQIEVEIETVVTDLYLSDQPLESNNDINKPEGHETAI